MFDGLLCQIQDIELGHHPRAISMSRQTACTRTNTNTNKCKQTLTSLYGVIADHTHPRFLVQVLESALPATTDGTVHLPNRGWGVDGITTPAFN